LQNCNKNRGNYTL